MGMLLVKPNCEIERDEFGDDTFECITLGRNSCPKEKNKFCLNHKCFIGVK